MQTLAIKSKECPLSCIKLFNVLKIILGRIYSEWRYSCECKSVYMWI